MQVTEIAWPHFLKAIFVLAAICACKGKTSSSGSKIPVEGTIVFSADTTDLGSTPVGTPFSGTLEIQNGGQTALTLESAEALTGDFSFNGGTFPGTGGDCGDGLAPGAKCAIDISFAATTAGIFTTELIINYDNSRGGQASTNHVIQATASPPEALLNISDGATFDFGVVEEGQSSSKIFTITNIGTQDATNISAVSFANIDYSFAGGTFPGTGGDCGTTLSGSSSTCLIEVEFSPSSVAVITDEIRLDYHDGFNTTFATRALTGEGVPALTIASISPSNGSRFDATTITINGTNFRNTPTPPTVTINGVNCVNVTFVSSSQITCETGQSAAGTFDVIVANSGGGAVNSSPAQFTYNTPATFVVVQVILTANCASCHTSGSSGGANFSSYNGASGGVLAQVTPGNADVSRIIVRGTSVGSPMPPGGLTLSSGEVQSIRDWINDGAQNN